MKILFIKNVARVAQMNEVKEVADGYAKFLINNKLGVPATESLIKQNQKKIEEAQMRAKGEESFVYDLAKKVNGLNLELKGNRNNKGNLYKPYHADDIAEELTKKIIVGVDAKYIEDTNIKTTGSHNVNLIFKGKTLATFTVEVL